MARNAMLTNTPADVLAYQNELIRTGQVEPLGRMQKIAIAPNAAWNPPPKGRNPFVDKFGRMIDLRRNVLPIAQSKDHSMVLVTAPLTALPDLPDPEGRIAPWTRDEIEGKAARGAEKDSVRMIPQTLRERAEGLLENTNFLVFSPVVMATFQPELNQEMQPTIWLIHFDFNPADNTHPTLLVNERTGETHFYGGRYTISTAAGE